MLTHEARKHPIKVLSTPYAYLPRRHTHPSSTYTVLTQLTQYTYMLHIYCHTHTHTYVLLFDSGYFCSIVNGWSWGLITIAEVYSNTCQECCLHHWYKYWCRCTGKLAGCVVTNHFTVSGLCEGGEFLSLPFFIVATIFPTMYYVHRDCIVQ